MPCIVPIRYLLFGDRTHEGVAEAVARGAEASGTKVLLLAIRSEDINQARYQNEHVLAQLDGSDAIVFGSRRVRRQFMGDERG